MSDLHLTITGIETPELAQLIHNSVIRMIDDFNSGWRNQDSDRLEVVISPALPAEDDSDLVTAAKFALAVLRLCDAPHSPNLTDRIAEAVRDLSEALEDDEQA